LVILGMIGKVVTSRVARMHSADYAVARCPSVRHHTSVFCRNS